MKYVSSSRAALSVRVNAHLPLPEMTDAQHGGLVVHVVLLGHGAQPGEQGLELWTVAV